MNNSIVLAISDGGKSLTVSLERRLASILLQPYGNKHTKTLVGRKMYTQYSFGGGGGTRMSREVSGSSKNSRN